MELKGDFSRSRWMRNDQLARFYAQNVATKQGRTDANAKSSELYVKKVNIKLHKLSIRKNRGENHLKQLHGKRRVACKKKKKFQLS